MRLPHDNKNISMTDSQQKGETIHIQIFEFLAELLSSQVEQPPKIDDVPLHPIDCNLIPSLGFELK